MEYYLNTPLGEDIRKLKTGDIVYLSGTVITARDKAHMKAINSAEKLDFLSNSAIHCPMLPACFCGFVSHSSFSYDHSHSEFFDELMLKCFHSAARGGPGDHHLPFPVFPHYGPAVVYCTFTGGAAVLAARAIKSVRDVIWLDELGTTEAMWVFEVEKFGPLVVAIDSHGNNLTEEIKMKAEENLKEILRFV